MTACFGAAGEELATETRRKPGSLAGTICGGRSRSGPRRSASSYTLQALDYDEAYDRGTFHGLDGDSIRELLNTIGRYGVIDRHIAGANGWRSRLRLPPGTVASPRSARPSTTRITSPTLRPRSITSGTTPSARRAGSSRGSATRPATPCPALGIPQPATTRPQWGYLLDSQPDYVICVAEQFDMTGDLAWLRSQKQTCERVLDYLLRRDSDGNGLVEMMTKSHKEGKGSDWIDVVWASHENALINAEMYAALTLWAEVEHVLGDRGASRPISPAAAKLKAAFNKPIAEGGFWNPANGWYVYWRNADRSIHGDNLVTPVNFAAIAYGLCDDPARRETILRQIEARMQKEKLFHWPLCFDSFAKDEVYAAAIGPFPAMRTATSSSPGASWACGHTPAPIRPWP